MARKPRFNLIGYPQHVIQRGNNGEACFHGADDYGFYLRCLGEACERYRCEVHAYVMMVNHVHLLVTPQVDYAISQVMQSVGRRYVQRVNKCRQRSGTLWQGRYKASLVDADAYLLAIYRYIELNPVRANVVNAPGDYLWSSYRHNAKGETDSLIIEHPLYLALGADDASRRQAYHRLFVRMRSNGMTESIREALHQEMVLGDDHFKDRIKRMTGYNVRPGKSGGLARL